MKNERIKNNEERIMKKEEGIITVENRLAETVFFVI